MFNWIPAFAGTTKGHYLGQPYIINWIPAFAGTTKGHYLGQPYIINWIPAFAGTTNIGFCTVSKRGLPSISPDKILFNWIPAFAGTTKGHYLGQPYIINWIPAFAGTTNIGFCTVSKRGLPSISPDKILFNWIPAFAGTTKGHYLGQPYIINWIPAFAGTTNIGFCTVSKRGLPSISPDKILFNWIPAFAGTTKGHYLGQPYIINWIPAFAGTTNIGFCTVSKRGLPSISPDKILFNWIPAFAGTTKGHYLGQPYIINWIPAFAGTTNIGFCTVSKRGLPSISPDKILFNWIPAFAGTTKGHYLGQPYIINWIPAFAGTTNIGFCTVSKRGLPSISPDKILFNWIPAFAGTTKGHYLGQPYIINWIPAFAGTTNIGFCTVSKRGLPSISPEKGG